MLKTYTAHDAANKSGQQEIKDAIGDHNSSVMAGQEGLTNAVKVHDEGIRVAYKRRYRCRGCRFSGVC